MLLFVVRQCSNRDADVAPTDRAKENDVSHTSAPPEEVGIPFDVASDPNASYRLLKWSRVKNGNIEAVTVREGLSGMDFARREIDCTDRTYRGLGEGETFREAMRPLPSVGDMTDLVDGSIAAVTVDVVCAEARK